MMKELKVLINRQMLLQSIFVTIFIKENYTNIIKIENLLETNYRSF